jgi:RNA polymerase sigma factor (sigma-70 family)
VKPEPGDFERLEQDFRVRDRLSNQIEDLSAFCAAIRGRDEDAIEKLYAEVKRRYLPMLRLRTTQPADAEDIADEVFMAALQGIWSEALSHPSKLWHWTMGICIYRLRDFYDHKSRRRERQEIGGDLYQVLMATAPEPRPNQEKKLIAEEERRAKAKLVLEAWSALSGTDREIIRRFYFAGETREQIEREMLLTPNQFRLHKWRAKAEMQNHARNAITKRELIEQCRKRAA